MQLLPKSKKIRKILSTVSVISLTAVLTVVMYYTQQLGDYFEASILTAQKEQKISFDGAVYPIKTIPNWLEWKGDVHTDHVSTVPSNQFIALPEFDRTVLSAQITDTSDNRYEEVRNAQLTYTVLWTGNYKLDHTENTGSHPGVDIRAPIGTPVYSIANGIVIATENKSTGFGKYVVIKHPNTPSGVVYSNYAHLNSMSVKVGEIVTKDQQIGEIGNTGTSTTPHIHFQIDKESAEWHPYWPFSFADMNAQGLSFFEAVNAGLGKSNVKKYTINPMDWIEENKSKTISVPQNINNDTDIDSASENIDTNEEPDVTITDDASDNDNSEEKNNIDNTQKNKDKENDEKVNDQESKVLQKFNIQINQNECLVGQTNSIEVSARNANNKIITDYKPSQQFKITFNGEGNITLLETLQFVSGKAQARFICEQKGDVEITLFDAGVSISDDLNITEPTNSSEAQLFGFEFYTHTKIQPNQKSQIRVVAKDRKGNTIKDYRPSTPISIILWGEGETNKSTLGGLDFSNGEATFYFEHSRETLTNITVGNAQVTIEVTNNINAVTQFEVKHDGEFEVNKTETLEVVALDSNKIATQQFQFAGKVKLTTTSGTGIFEPEYLTQTDFFRGAAKVKFTPQSTQNTSIVAQFNDIKSSSTELANVFEINKPQPKFADLNENHKNYKAISYLYGENILNGYPNGTYQPEKTVNRVEAIKILLLSNGIAPNTKLDDLPFSDTNINEWYAPYLETAYTNGVINGYPDGKFRPNQDVNRVEFLKMALELKGIATDPNTGSIYSDIQRNAWYAPYAIYTKERNLLETKNNQLKPTKGMSRAEVAEMIYRINVLEQTQAQVYTPDLSI